MTKSVVTAYLCVDESEFDLNEQSSATTSVH